jgi:hypothetical protein
MAETPPQPALDAAILDLYPGLRQLGIDTMARVLGQAMTLVTHWRDTNPEQLPAEELARVLKAHYLNVATCISELEALAERLSACFTPTLEAYIKAHFDEERFEGDPNY